MDRPRTIEHMQGSTDRRIGPKFLKRDAGIHGPPDRSEFLKGIQDSTDRRIGPNFKSEIHGPLNRSSF